MAKYIEKQDIKKIIESERKIGKKIVLACGSFDVLTVFDIRYLRAAKKSGDILIVAVYSDDLIKQKFGEKRSITSFEDRIEILKGMEMVDYILCASDDKVNDILSELKPDSIIPERADGYDVVQAVLAKFKNIK